MLRIHTDSSKVMRARSIASLGQINFLDAYQIQLTSAVKHFDLLYSNFLKCPPKTCGHDINLGLIPECAYRKSGLRRHLLLLTLESRIGIFS